MDSSVTSLRTQDDGAEQHNHSAINPVQTFPELPPQSFTTAAHLLELTDKKVLLILRDGRKLVGVLRSWDQFANLVFRDIIERFYDPAFKVWGEIPEHGTQIIRGENVVMLGEMALEQDDEMPELWTQVSTEQIQELQRRNQQTALALEKRKKIASGKNGFEVESVGEIFI